MSSDYVRRRRETRAWVFRLRARTAGTFAFELQERMRGAPKLHEPRASNTPMVIFVAGSLSLGWFGCGNAAEAGRSIGPVKLSYDDDQHVAGKCADSNKNDQSMVDG
ncbi:hypothetical protein LY78DRAFT_658751 [Colletotrichum sublineola]|nr:hypothetical protein LY78DRAFT_658751 [Colletotrichum sublineola]